MHVYTLSENKIANPVCLQAITSEWSPWIDNEFFVIALAVTWKTVGVSSPAIKYISGTFNNNPYEHVKVVVKLPEAKAPWIAPAAPPSDYIIST